jgi:hypothetical protein
MQKRWMDSANTPLSSPTTTISNLFAHNRTLTPSGFNGIFAARLCPTSTEQKLLRFSYNPPVPPSVKTIHTHGKNTFTELLGKSLPFFQLYSFFFKKTAYFPNISHRFLQKFTTILPFWQIFYRNSR